MQHYLVKFLQYFHSGSDLSLCLRIIVKQNPVLSNRDNGGLGMLDLHVLLIFKCELMARPKSSTCSSTSVLDAVNIPDRGTCFITSVCWSVLKHVQYIWNTTHTKHVILKFFKKNYTHEYNQQCIKSVHIFYIKSSSLWSFIKMK